MFNIENLTDKYAVREISEEMLDEVLKLAKSNSMYFEYYPPMATIESLKEDLKALPPHTTIDNKYFLGYYQDNKLIAIIDLITGYPSVDSVFIGWFMVDDQHSKQGIGTSIINELKIYLKTKNFKEIRLAFVKNNPQAAHFWLKNNFEVILEKLDQNNPSITLCYCCYDLSK